jgi:hypothetical protein
LIASSNGFEEMVEWLLGIKAMVDAQDTVTEREIQLVLYE